MIVKNQSEYYSELLGVLEEYGEDIDEAVRAHVPIPLTELAKRLRSKDDDGSIHITSEINGRIRALAFKMLREAAPAVADRLANVFCYLRDIGDDEALEVVEVLSAKTEREGRADAAALLLYFSIFREHQFPELGRFDPSRIRLLLNQILVGTRGSLRSSIVWTMWKALKENVNLEDLLPYLHKTVEGVYERGTFNHLYRIITIGLKNGDSRFCELFLAAIQREAEFLSGGAERQVWHFKDFEESVLQTKSLCHETFEQIRAVLRQYSQQLGYPILYN
jgi:hypothetical protein